MILNRNANSRFSQLPSVDIQRSKFDRPSTLKTTFNAGELIPIYCDEVLPGDTHSVDVASLVRMSTPIFPVMDNAYLDTYFFFVPNRILWEHWKEFNGENTESYWTAQTEYVVPQLRAPALGWDKGSLADYFGLPTLIGGFSVSQLPFRAYVAIWNEWFRDQNTMQPAYNVKNDSTLIGKTRESADAVSIDYNSALYGGKPLPVSKFHDYFTSTLPAPQKGPAVSLPLFDSDVIPVTTNNAVNIDTTEYPTLRFGASVSNSENDGVPVGLLSTLAVSSAENGKYAAYANLTDSTGVSSVNDVMAVTPSNLALDVNSIAAATINQLRQAFQIQKLYERDARGGTRYREILLSHFGVVSPDARQQVPEYLGGKRVPINVDQVLQTSSTDSVSPQGNTAAFSLTTDVNSAFSKSFTEHGLLIGLACVRTDHTYQQGIERMWSRKRRFDYYWPALAHIGEQAVLKKEIYCTGTAFDDEAFGYQEAWADYRYKPSRVCGAFRSNVVGSLDAWHYADYFDQDPETFVLQADFIKETSVNVNRTLAVQSDLEDQFICDFAFRNTCVRPMPLYSVPGLIDHY